MRKFRSSFKENAICRRYKKGSKIFTTWCKQARNKGAEVAKASKSCVKHESIMIFTKNRNRLVNF